MTFLFDQTVFGPVTSRRLGVSLGINLLPNNRKWCNFDCLYCECGWNPLGNQMKVQLPTRAEVAEKLEVKLQEMQQAGQLPDVITFAGNGEPTMHPDFVAIMDDTLALRGRYCPQARISVLSNATMLHKPGIVGALRKVDQNILKLDSGRPATLRFLNRPTHPVTAEGIASLMKQFEGRCIIQTLFVRGSFQGRKVDNTTQEELQAWIRLVREAGPSMVMIYTIDRDTPARDMHKVPVEELQLIAREVEALGIPVQISG
jgi:wyosine [tRNA(Phe)-imidazoG37] synthetase (radical SAM superfamily)